MAQSAERAAAIGRLRGMRGFLDRVVITAYRLPDIDGERYVATAMVMLEDLAEMVENNRRQDKAFFKRYDKFEQGVTALRDYLKPKLDVLEMQEMQAYEEKGSLIQVDLDGQAELVVDSPSLPVDNEGTKFKPEESNMKQVPESETKKHGGKRAGAGRKGIGRTEKVSVSLPPEEWDFIDGLIANGHVASRAEYIRRLHMANRYPDEYLIPLGGGENT